MGYDGIHFFIANNVTTLAVYLFKPLRVGLGCENKRTFDNCNVRVVMFWSKRESVAFGI